MFKEEELTREIIGIAMRVHNQLGPGFKESIYHQGMIVALEAEGYVVETERQFKVYLNNICIGIFRVDIIVNRKVVVEIKAVGGEMPRIFQSQLVSYLKAARLEVGLLLNFGNPSLEIKRIAHYYNLSKSSMSSV